MARGFFRGPAKKEVAAGERPPRLYCRPIAKMLVRQAQRVG